MPGGAVAPARASLILAKPNGFNDDKHFGIDIVRKAIAGPMPGGDSMAGLSRDTRRARARPALSLSARPHLRAAQACAIRAAMDQMHPPRPTRPRSAALSGLLALVLMLPLFLTGCGDDKEADANNVAAAPVEDMYNNGLDALNAKRFQTAEDQFAAVQQNYPYSSWAVNAQLMQGYTQYLRNHYTDAIGTLDRFSQLHPAHHDIAYAYYLRSLSYYEQITDIQRDQHGTEQALNALRDVVNRFPESPYARDAKLKIDLCVDHLAGKEMEVGRWYEHQHLYEAAIGRFQKVVDDYQTTNHVAEALHRLTEIYLILGLKDQARKTAAVLGHNYPGSPWYSDSYADLVGDRPLGAADDMPPNGQRGFMSRAWHAIF